MVAASSPTPKFCRFDSWSGNILRPRVQSLGGVCTELSNQIANLSDTKFKILVIRVLTELAEYGHKIEEKVKVMQN